MSTKRYTRKLRVVRDRPREGPEIVHDANEYLKSDPLNGVGVPSSWPIFAAVIKANWKSCKVPGDVERIVEREEASHLLEMREQDSRLCDEDI